MPTEQRRLRNQDYTDRELLLVINDVIKSQGEATTTEIALKLGFSTNGNKGVTPARKVSTRLSAMRLGGLLDRKAPAKPGTPEEPGARDSTWEITPEGKEIMNGTLTKAFSKGLEKMKPGAQILVMRELTQRAYVAGEFTTAWAVRREFQHQQARRKLGRRK